MTPNDGDTAGDGDNNDESSSDGSNENTSDDTALTPEQRDDVTIARMLGEPAPQDDDKPEDNDGDGDASDGDDDSDSDSDDSSDDGSDHDDDSGDSDDSTGDGDSSDEDEDTSADGDTAGDGESDADDDLELTDEDIETFLDAADDRIVSSPRMQKIIEQMVKAQTDKRFADRLEQTEVSQETQRLIEKGGRAATNIEKLFEKAGTTLAEYVAGNTVEEEVVLDPEALKGNLKDFAIASVVRTRQGYDNAFAGAFREVAPLTGDAFTEDEAKDVMAIVQTADRIRQDPEQGETAANAYLFKESLKYLVERAVKSGASIEKADAQKRRKATKRVIGNKNNQKSAMAKIASKRKKVAPPAPKGEPKGSQPEFTMDAYRAAKLAGNIDEADAIMTGMAAAGQGQAVPGR